MRQSRCMVHFTSCPQHMDRWGVGRCRESDLRLLPLSKTQGSLVGQGAGMDKLWLLNSVHSCGNSRAAVGPRLCHMFVTWAMLVQGRTRATRITGCGKKWSSRCCRLQPGRASHFGIPHRAHLCPTAGLFSHHCRPPVTYSLRLPPLSALISHMKCNTHTCVSHAAWLYEDIGQWLVSSAILGSSTARLWERGKQRRNPGLKVPCSAILKYSFVGPRAQVERNLLITQSVGCQMSHVK